MYRQESVLVILYHKLIHIPRQSRTCFYSQLIDVCISVISSAEAGCIQHLAVISS